MISKKSLLKLVKEKKQKEAPKDLAHENIVELFAIKDSILNVLDSRVKKAAENGYGSVAVYDKEFGPAYIKYLNDNVPNKKMVLNNRDIAGFLANYIMMEDYKVFYIEKPIGSTIANDPNYFNFGLLIVWDETIGIENIVVNCKVVEIK